MQCQDPEKWVRLMPADFRAQLPALTNKTYFNYGGQGPLPTPALEAITTTWKQIQELGPFTGAVWPFIEQTTSRLRQHLARWFGVGPHRIAFTENVTSGCVLPLWGLPWQAGDELLISDCEHPGVVAACRELARRQGLKLATLPVADLRGTSIEAEAMVLQRLEQRLTPATRLVVLSHLLWNTGQLMPIAAVARQLASHGQRPWLLVDAAQSLGSIPIAEAAAAADIYACTGHKWCCGPEGLGAVALSERILQESQPTLIGWRSLSHEGNSLSPFMATADVSRWPPPVCPSTPAWSSHCNCWTRKAPPSNGWAGSNSAAAGSGRDSNRWPPRRQCSRCHPRRAL
jgi:L-cysteine/cystine lyase